jgi:endo-1,4-beta-xylanase
MRRTANILGLWLLLGAAALAQHPSVPLWPNGAPGSEGKTAPEVVTQINAEGEHTVTTIHAPSIAPYLVRGAKSPVAAIIVAPGGGHALLSIDHEGYDVAKYLSGHGVAAFVLKYRLAREKGSTYTVEGDALADMQRAVRMVKARAAEWGVDPARVGVMGFSAGGELAILAAERFDAANPAAPDPIDRESDRPAFEVLMYPGGLTPEIVAKVAKDTPPAFLLCGADDRENISQMLPELFVAMRKAGVSAELHEYAGVGHGFGLRLSQHGAVAGWPQLLVDWLDAKGFLRAKVGKLAAERVADSYGAVGRPWLGSTHRTWIGLPARNRKSESVVNSGSPVYRAVEAIQRSFLPMFLAPPGQVLPSPERRT